MNTNCRLGFVYYCKSAPPKRGKLPGSCIRLKVYPERQYVAEIDAMAYGEIETFRQLEPWEIVRYGLIAAPVE